ncbi:MAG TPA: hypothetical protein VHA75_14410, partial [Rugosimonospora sp.]|nr:hypothetical protein [Rugosimonospora sp.]
MTGTMWKRHPTTNDWAIYGPRDVVTVAAEVTVTTRAGKTTTHYIAATARGGRGMIYGFPGHRPEPVLDTTPPEPVCDTTPPEPVFDCKVEWLCTGHCADAAAHAAYTAARFARKAA